MKRGRWTIGLYSKIALTIMAVGLTAFLVRVISMRTLETIVIPTVSSAIAVVIAVFISHLLGKRQRLYEMKSGVLREFVGRRANLQDPDFKIALNSIPIVFHDNEDIKTAWKEYYDTIKELKNKQLETKLKKPQLKLKSLAGDPLKELTNLANKQFVVLALVICKSLNIKAKENDVRLVFK